MSAEARLVELHLQLPEAPRVPPGVVIDFAWARLYEDRLYLAGHGPTGLDGAVVGPFGRVGEGVTPEQALESARLAALGLMGSARRALGDLDRIAAWLRIDGFVLVAPGFDRTTAVINAASRLILDVFGREVGTHARTAMGVAATPLSCPVVLAAELAIKR
jgi:hypothetical protein